MRAKLLKGLLSALLVLGLLLPGCAVFSLFPQDSAHRAQTLANDIQVLEQKADEGGRVAVVIKLQGASLAGVEEGRVVEELKQQAAQSQKRVLEWLKTRGATVLNTFWLSNAILAEVPVGMLDEFVSLTTVERLFENSEITIPEPPEEESLPAALAVDCTWGLEKIRAPEVWDMNITGSGVRVAVLDTGVDMDHADLAGKMWTDNPTDPTYPGGWIEFNSYGDIVVGSEPHDTDEHGTHTSGTCVGGNASGIAIGVAPGAWLMHGLVIPGGSGTVTQIIAGMEWCMSPVDQYGSPAGEPADVVSMSLGGSGHYDAFIEPVQNIRAAGIVLVAAIGNDGEETSGSPGNVYESFGIGATDIDDEVAWFSSGEVVDWPASHPEPYIKPDFSAPGVDVYSSVPGGYKYLDGTSMATPHVAGTVALILEANPALTVEDVYDVLYQTAVDLGDIWQDTRYGWGRIDAFEAVSLVTLESGIEGFVTDAQTEEPLEGVEISISETGRLRYTDGSGYYRSFLPPGTYNVTASAYGYYGQNATIEVVADAFTSQNFTLEPVPTGFIEGTVTDSETHEPIEGAVITLLDTPLSTATNETGGYSIEALVGTYNISAWTWGYRESVIPDVTVAENETVTVNFTLEPVLAVVAVLGDYESQLTDLLVANDFWAEERDWDIITDIYHYDAVVVNCPDDPGSSTFLEFLEAASDNHVGVVFTSSYSTYSPYGISLLRWYLGDPAGQSNDWGDGDVYYQVRQSNPLLEGWGEGDNLTIITGGDCDHTWFSNYSGSTIAVVGSEDQGIRGDAVALGAYGESLHVLLASLAPQYYTNVPDWTEDAKTIFIRGVLAAGGLVDVGLFVGSRELPLAVVGEEYQATLKAFGGTKPYTWAIVNSTLPNGLGLDGGTGVISGIPTEAGTCNFTVQVTDYDEVTATRELALTTIALSEFITDPVGDQLEGSGPDMIGADFCLDNTTIYFRVRTAEAIDPNDTLSYMLLDLDLNAQTGFVSDDPLLPTNDIGADAVAIVLPTSMAGKELPLPIQRRNGEQQLGLKPAQLSSTGLTGQLYVWALFGFWYVGDFPVINGNQSFFCSIPRDMLDDDGIMSVVDIIGNSSEPTDVAPNEGHGITGQGPDLVISDKWEQWVGENQEAYEVDYTLKNQGNVAIPPGHTIALTVDGTLLEADVVSVALNPGEEYSGHFLGNVIITPPIDEIRVCSDLYDVVDELSEENNCLSNLWTREPAWTEIITDPVGDQFDDYGPDIVGIDFYLDNTMICFRVRTAAAVDPDLDINEMLLDLDQRASTGYDVSGDAGTSANDIGVDACALVVPAWLVGEELSSPLQVGTGELQLESLPSQALPQEQFGILELWDPDLEEFFEAGNFSVFTGNQSLWFALPLDILNDDGYMNVVDLAGDFNWGITDVAPDQGHGSNTVPGRMGCFIATAAYGTDTAKELDILREFRDTVLLPNSLGARLVSFYYKTSPPVADFISQHESIRAIVRVGFVHPIVRILGWAHSLWSTSGP